jgi:hypothetical protein
MMSEEEDISMEEYGRKFVHYQFTGWDRFKDHFGDDVD